MISKKTIFLTIFASLFICNAAFAVEEVWCHNFNVDLIYGSSGTEVEALQIALQKQGFAIDKKEIPQSQGGLAEKAQFGSSTAAAVSGFQIKYYYEILRPLYKAPTSQAKSKTRLKLNKLYGCKSQNVSSLPPVSQPKSAVSASSLAQTNAPLNSSLTVGTTSALILPATTSLGILPGASATTASGVVATDTVPGATYTYIYQKIVSGSENYPVRCSCDKNPKLADCYSKTFLEKENKGDYCSDWYLSYKTKKAKIFKRTKITVPPGEVSNFYITNSNFVVSGKNLKRVEIWAIPTSTSTDEKSWLKLGEASFQQISENIYKWTLPVKECPLVDRIFARGFDWKENKIKDIYLPYKGTGEIEQNVCRSIISLTLLSPNGGESYKIGQKVRIKWKAERIKNISIQIFDDRLYGEDSIRYVSFPSLEALNFPAKEGFYDWTITREIPNVSAVDRGEGNNYKIVISADVNGKTVRDFSDIPFKITSESAISLGADLLAGLDPSTPAPKAVYEGSNDVPLAKFKLTALDSDVPVIGIKVGKKGGDFCPFQNFKISLSDGSTFLAASTSAGCFAIFDDLNLIIPKTYSKTLFLTADVYSFATSGEGFVFGIFSLASSKIPFNASGLPAYANPITVLSSAKPSLILSSPNGGEKWEMGKSYPIYWKSSNLPDDAKISIRLNQVGSTLIIAPGEIIDIANDGSEEWRVPTNIYPGKYLLDISAVFVSASQTVNLTDSSDSAFEIGPAGASSGPAEKNCSDLEDRQKYYFEFCKNNGYEGACFNKFSGDYQGCNKNPDNYCTLNNPKAQQNILCPTGYVQATSTLFSPLSSDSDKSPDYQKNPVASYPLTPEKYPDLFAAGRAKSIYFLNSDLKIHLIYGLEPEPWNPKTTTESYSLYYDYCADSSHLREAYLTGDGRLGVYEASCPYGCQNSACLKSGQ